MKIQMTEQLRDAAQLMEQRKYTEAAAAYERIVQAQPEHAALCHSQIGAAYYFLERYHDAITEYRRAEALGFSPEMTADNIREAELAIAAQRTPAQAMDYAALIAGVPGRRKRLLAPPLPPKKETNIRANMPPTHQAAPICGLIDLTVFGSAKRGVVFTDTHCLFVDDEPWQFAWSDLLGVDGYTGFAEDTVALRLREGRRELYLGSAGDEALPVLQAIAAANSAVGSEVSPGGSVLLRHTTVAEGQDSIGYSDDQRISAHLETVFGGDWTVWHELISDRVHLDVHMLAPTAERLYYVLVTSGMSALPMTVPDDLPDPEQWQFAELCLFLPADWPMDRDSLDDEANYWPIRLLKDLARLPHDFATWLSWGHTVPNGDPAEPYSPDLPFCGAVVIPPFAQQDLYEVPGERPLRIFQVLPITDSEMQLKLQAGVDEMLEAIEAVEPHPYGPNCVSRATVRLS